MNIIKFSKIYPKLWGQTQAELLAVKEIEINENTNKDLIEYDTKAIDGSYYELKKGKYLQLIFLGNKNIPFCTIRSKYGSYVNKTEYYKSKIGEIFDIVIDVKNNISSVDFDSLLKNIEMEQRDPQPLKESDVQALVFKYLENRDLDSHPSLSGIKAKSWGQIRFMKKQGIKKGHPDLMIEEPAGKYQIFFLELKKIGGRLSDDQKDWLKRHIAKGHACSVSYGYYDAIYKIEKYLQGEPVIWEE